MATGPRLLLDPLGGALCLLQVRSVLFSSFLACWGLARQLRVPLGPRSALARWDGGATGLALTPRRCPAQIRRSVVVSSISMLYFRRGLAGACNIASRSPCGRHSQWRRCSPWGHRRHSASRRSSEKALSLSSCGSASLFFPPVAARARALRLRVATRGARPPTPRRPLVLPVVCPLYLVRNSRLISVTYSWVGSQYTRCVPHYVFSTMCFCTSSVAHSRGIPVMRSCALFITRESSRPSA